LALLSVHRELQPRLNETADAVHHPFGRFGRPDEEVAVIGKSAKVQAAPLPFPVEFIQNNIAE
jgi:hypothetical protein